MTKDFLVAPVYISKNKELYNHFLEQKVIIAEFLGDRVIWHEASIDVVLGYDTYDVDFSSDNWKGKEYFEWYCEKTIKPREVVKKFAE